MVTDAKKKIVYNYKYKRRNMFLVSKNNFIHISGVNVYYTRIQNLKTDQ